MKKALFPFLFFVLSSLTFTTSLYAEKEILLKNIEQVTNESMGFEKAGEGYFSPDGKKIIFQAVPKGKRQFQIYVMDLIDRIPFMVSTGKGACTCANFRADGKKIIFASSHENPHLEEEETQQTTKNGNYKWNFTPYMNVYEANLDGSDRRALTTGSAYHAECSYSVDGTKIVYASNEDGHMNLYTMLADGSNQRQITFNKHCYYGGPFFSPDGKSILFRADKDKPDYLQLYTINIENLKETQYTNNGAVNWAPYWYPNGKCIAYTTSIHGHHQYEIYLLNIYSNQEKRITFNPSFDGLPVFDTTGKKLLWTSKRGGKNSQLFLADFNLPKEFYEKN